MDTIRITFKLTLIGPPQTVRRFARFVAAVLRGMTMPDAQPSTVSSMIEQKER